MIIDWKTNRITRGEVSALRERYRPQLAAYWKAMTEITGFEWKPDSILLPTGVACFYKTDELAARMAATEQLPR